MDAERTLADRDLRQRELVPPQKLAACHGVVVGVGAIGRQVALQLVAMGIASLELFDPDTVGVENLACQGYWPADLSRPKVQATGHACRVLNPQLHVVSHAEPFRRSSARALGRFGQDLAVFCCVDSISTRGLVFQSVKEKAAFFADGRMSAEVIRVLCSPTPADDAYYATTLFSESEAYAGPCTARSTIYTASIAAGLMLGQFARWLRGLPTDRDVLLNLLAGELSTQ